jgi:uncharacterized protein (TIGR03067 family)
MMKGYLIVLLVSVLAFASIAWSDPDPEDAKLIQGTWVPISATLAGNEFPEQIRNSIKLVLTAETYLVTVGEAPDEGKCKLDPSKTPKTLDITGVKGPNKGKTILAIYELHGDKLRVCYDLSGKARPKEFKTKSDTQLFLVEYKRQKGK